MRGGADHLTRCSTSRCGRANTSSPRRRGPILRSLSRDCGVWIPGLACARPGRQRHH